MTSGETVLPSTLVALHVTVKCFHFGRPDTGPSCPEKTNGARSGPDGEHMGSKSPGRTGSPGYAGFHVRSWDPQRIYHRHPNVEPESKRPSVESKLQIKVVPASGTKWAIRALFDLVMGDAQGSGYRTGDARVVVRNQNEAEVILKWTKTTEEAEEIADRAYRDLSVLGLTEWCQKYHVRQEWAEET